ncbi:hypothetical protein [Virgibacillus sp. YIM 98842]|uniref:hypothetical protein n=1 Tax=Virgibacillus sp. YIM 98842 TaxID=2663533 RepID=UPI0013D91C2E|nr:hypothetical protein [Virgibacillus sp. YIM 98842]
MTEQRNQEESGNTAHQYVPTPNNSSGIRPALIGSAAGIGIGLLASPAAGRSMAGAIIQSKLLRNSTRELCRSVQGMITEQAVYLLKQGVVNSIYQYRGELGQLLKRSSSSSGPQQSLSEDQYIELKKENEKLNDRLGNIEEKLDSLLEKLKDS